MNKYTAKVDRVTLFSFDSDRAALDEFTSLNKALLIFGGFGLGREKPGHGREWLEIYLGNKRNVYRCKSDSERID